MLIVESPTIASTSLCVVTRRIDPIFTPRGTIFGAEFTATVPLARPVEGVVAIPSLASRCPALRFGN